MFCSKCGGLLKAKDDCRSEFICTNPRCGSEQKGQDLSKDGATRMSMKQKTREVEDCPVVGGIEGVMPKTATACPKCGHNEAYWYLRQTRKSDEPETTFLTCCSCSHKWRKY